MNILVTGSNGFVGKALCLFLEKEGHAVRRILRSETSVTDLNAEFIVGDINATTDWSTLLHGMDIVVHLAARVHVMDERHVDPSQAYIESNTKGTLNLALQASEHGVQRFVYISSVKVNGEGTRHLEKGSNVYNEDDQPNPFDDYAISKLKAELGLAEISEKTSMEYVIIRPPLVYGPNVKANFLRLLKLVDFGIPLPLKRLKNKRSLVYLGNLIAFILVCIKEPKANGETFLVADEEVLSTNELITLIAFSLHKTARLFYVPQKILYYAGLILGKSTETDRLCGSLQVNTSKAKQLLMWHPPFTIQEAMKHTADWYLSHKKK